MPERHSALFYPPFEQRNDGDTIALAGEALYVSRNNGDGVDEARLTRRRRRRGPAHPDADAVYVGHRRRRRLRTTVDRRGLERSPR